MHDEIIKHTENIVKATKKESSFFDKFKEILTEILIIVFAVTISIWFHSISEKHHQQKETEEFLKDLKVDLNQDIKNMTKYQSNLTKFSNQIDKLSKINKSKLDSATSLDFKIITRKTTIADYDGFKSSGKIGYIENKKLKSKILKYYQENTPSLRMQKKCITICFGKQEYNYRNRESKKNKICSVVKARGVCY